MKYKVILIFLMSCIIIVSIALFTYVFLNKDITKIEENQINLNQRSQSERKKENINTAQIEGNIANEETNNTLENENKEENKIEEKTYIEEQNSEKETDKQDEEQMALKLVKEEWGEDESVYYTIDRNIGNMYDISVRSKANTLSLMEYEVDVENKTVKMK